MASLAPVVTISHILRLPSESRDLYQFGIHELSTPRLWEWTSPVITVVEPHFVGRCVFLQCSARKPPCFLSSRPATIETRR
eukprot:1518367-Rhodomonas_salina.1